MGVSVQACDLNVTFFAELTLILEFVYDTIWMKPLFAAHIPYHIIETMKNKRSNCISSGKLQCCYHF